MYFDLNVGNLAEPISGRSWTRQEIAGQVARRVARFQRHGLSRGDRVFLPFGRLQLAGWSKDTDGVLDLRRVGEIRVGWGGYVGREGEQIEFSLRAPRAGLVPTLGSN